jgi:MscS family membrane protein
MTSLPWLMDVFAVLSASAVAHAVLYLALGQIERLVRRTSVVWDDAVLRAARRPAQVIVWVIGLAVAGRIIERHGAHPLLEYIDPARKIGIILCLAWFLLRLIHCVTENVVAARMAKGEEVDRTTADALSKLGRISVLVVAVLVVMQTLGFSISGVLAFGGIGGIAVGFAAKDLLANFFGGLTIYLDRPFSVGEWIRSPDKQIEGTVEYISWRHTRIRAFNKNPIYVPNSVFTSVVVENPSRMSHRRLRETVGVRYADLGKLPAIIADIETMLRARADIDTTQSLIVNFNAFAESALDIFIVAYCTTTDWAKFHTIKQAILFDIAAIISRHGAGIAFPTRTLLVETAGSSPTPTSQG